MRLQLWHTDLEAWICDLSTHDAVIKSCPGWKTVSCPGVTSLEAHQVLDGSSEGNLLLLNEVKLQVLIYYLLHQVIDYYY